ncbi:AfsR/SARP family transcriptional regulator [Pseudochelatococcus sp. B33]
MGFSLYTFGGVRLKRPDASEAEVPTRRARALLLFLVMHRNRAVHREVICATLWPDASEASARSQLRKALWRIRVAAGPDEAQIPLIVNEYQIGLDPRRLQVDAWDFTDMLGDLELKGDGSLTDGDARRLLRALEISQGLFGQGIFDDWLLAEQESQAEARIIVMERLIAYHRVQGNLNQAISWAQKVLKMDPLREHLHASIIECRQAMGDRALAIRQFRECAEVLKREVGVAPSAQVRALYERLVREV